MKKRILLLIFALALILYPRSSRAACVIDASAWTAEVNNPLVGGLSTHVGGPPVQLRVTGTGCDGLAVSFDIYEHDLVDPDDFLLTLNATFVNGTAATTYTFTPTDYVNGGSETIPGEIVYFKASVFDASGVKLTTVTSAFIDFINRPGNLGGAGCGNGTPDAGEQCDLGTTRNGFCPSTCSTVCTTNACAGGPGGGVVVVPGGGGTTVNENFHLTNPLGVTNILGLINLIATWVFNIAIPIAVIMILYAGVKFLISRGEPGGIGQAKDILKWAVIGLAIVLIGRGFVDLIVSILSS